MPTDLELKIPPVVVVLLAAAGMWLLSRVGSPLDVPHYARLGFAAALVFVGFGVSASGIISFRRARTTVNPTKPEAASSLVDSGIYRFTRNPMYLGMLLVLVGWAVYLASIRALIMLPLFVIYMNRFQIQPEERALGELFGAEFESYKRSVRRWV